MKEGLNPFVRQASGLVKELSWYDVFIISIAAPAASGILYYSVNTQTAYPGGSVGIAFLIGMLVFLPIVYLVALLSAGMPRAGSLYVGISRVVGPHIAFIAAALFFIGQSMVAGVLGSIIISILGGISTASGLTLPSNFLVESGKALSTTGGKLVGGVVWVVLFWWITLRGMRPFRKTMRIFFALPFIASALTALVFLLTSKEGAAAAFNASWGSNAFQSILQLATANGWQPTAFSWGATLGLFLVVIWAYNGIEMASYAGGEVQTPRRSLVRGFVWGWLAVGLLYIVLAFVVFGPFGDFISAYDFVHKNHPESLAQIMNPMDPSVPFYIISIAPWRWFGILLALGIVLWFANSIPPIFLSTSRTIFALSMDRSVPAKLADVNNVTGAPTWATHVAALFALLGVLFYTLDVRVMMGTLLFCTFFIFWLYGYTAILLPYKKPEIYEQMPLKKKLFGVPLLSLAGLFCFFFGWFVMFFTLREITLEIALALAIIMLLIIVLYFIQQRRNYAEGCDLETIYSQLPPD